MMNLRLAGLLCLVLGCSACDVSFADELLDTKRQSFPAAGIANARFETGAGELDVRGRAGATEIEVIAEYHGSPRGGRDRQAILDALKLTMEVRGRTFYLRSENRDHSNWYGSGRIDLRVTVPAALDLEINDGAGDMSVVGVDGDVSIDDGSGGIDVADVGGNLKIHDGSGSIKVHNVRKGVRISDGSGSIDVTRVGGDVWIEDGSGGIEVHDVAGKLDVPQNGSGGVRYSDVRGTVNVPSRRKHSVD
jgi:hypothetical protein